MDYIAEKLAAAQSLQGDQINGLAYLKSNHGFVKQMQDMVLKSKLSDSDLTMDDLPPLPRKQRAAKKRKRKSTQPVVTVESTESTLETLEKSYVQRSFDF
jgi:hypothetical protein